MQVWGHSIVTNHFDSAMWRTRLPYLPIYTTLSATVANSDIWTSIPQQLNGCMYFVHQVDNYVAASYKYNTLNSFNFATFQRTFQ